MKKKLYDIKGEKPFIVSEKFILYEKQEEHKAEQHRKAILMTDMEKFHLFAKMLRRGIMFKNAVITHKPFPKDQE